MLTSAVAVPSPLTRSGLYASAGPKIPSSFPHCPRCTCHGYTPPGGAFEMATYARVLPPFLPGAIHAVPLTESAPARLDGVASDPLQRELRSTSPELISTAGLLRKRLHAP